MWIYVNDVISAGPKARPSNGTPQESNENGQVWTYVSDVIRASPGIRRSNGTPQDSAETFRCGPTSVTSLVLGQKLVLQIVLPRVRRKPSGMDLRQ